MGARNMGLAHKTKGPAEAATSPSHGSNHPPKDHQNMDSNITAEGGPATVEWLATQNFEPWKNDDKTEGPPSNKEWNGVGADMLPTARLAWRVMFKTKQELITFASDEPEMFMKLTDSIYDFIAWLEPFQRSLEAARVRMFIAASTVAMKEPEGSQ